MISSCSDCEVPCCQTGPGPHKNLPPDDYLENFGDAEAYNTKCIALTADGGCNLWGTPDFPHACRVYVCQTRSYTKDELEKIDEVIDRECPNCKSPWMVGKFISKDYHDSCEICGYLGKWKKEVVSRGKRKWKIPKMITTE